jgi:hypothetical protein
VPGATSFAVRNNADSADNLIITNAGAATVRTSLTVGNSIVVSAGGMNVTGTGTFNNNVAITGTVTSGTINSQTISAAANFTGSVTIANSLVVSAGGANITGAVTTSTTINSQTISAAANLTGTLTVASTLTQTAGNHYHGDTSNANMTLGMTINQGSADDEILAFKSSDVAHGMTLHAETDTYGLVRKASGANGGMQMLGLADTDTVALSLWAASPTDDTGKAISAFGVVNILAGKTSGTDIAVGGANSNLLAVQNGAGQTRFIFDVEGDSHQDVGTAWTNFDDHDDIALLDATAALMERDPGSLRKTFTDDFLAANKTALADARVVTFNDDGHHFVNWSRFHMLHMGATRLLADRLAAQDAEIAALKTRLALTEASGG